MLGDSNLRQTTGYIIKASVIASFLMSFLFIEDVGFRSDPGAVYLIGMKAIIYSITWHQFLSKKNKIVNLNQITILNFDFLFITAIYL
jgi:hypothetical protein